MTERQRLDRALEARGLVMSRARARDAILRGTVKVNGQVTTKPAQAVSEADIIVINDPASFYVSRAALKLIAGLDAGRIEVVGKTCLDVGASTGGFTEVLLERGAARVFAVDVGHEQMAEKLRADPRVTLIEGCNARDLTRAELPDPIDLLVCDVSFVSVEKVLAAPLGLCRPQAEAVILFKPQFEVGRAHVGKGGIVTDQTAIAEAKLRVALFLRREGWRFIAETPSPIAGGDGNEETVLIVSRTIEQ
ncbi:MAG: TlyA family RNA methyltransferase [Alphaproteobacteria bacterium]|nr:TlyA family RNA methyltransferase [Alphaproteobacteria bacterium]